MTPAFEFSKKAKVQKPRAWVKPSDKTLPSSEDPLSSTYFVFGSLPASVDSAAQSISAVVMELVKKRKQNCRVWKAGEIHRHAKQNRTLKANEWDTWKVSSCSSSLSSDGIEYFQAEHPGHEVRFGFHPYSGFVEHRYF